MNPQFRQFLAGGFVLLAVTLTKPTTALADGSHETMSGGIFTKFGADTVNEAERSVTRRGVSASRRENRENGSRSSKRRSKGRQVASLGNGASHYTPPKGSLSGGSNIRWAANAACLNGTLRGVVASIAASFGAVTVSSTCRSVRRNARAGGAPRSYHLTGNAVDFRVRGNISGAASYLSSRGGGYKHMGGGLFHIDTGPRRPF